MPVLPLLQTFKVSVACQNRDTVTQSRTESKTFHQWRFVANNEQPTQFESRYDITYIYVTHMA